jgi:putative ABC transport system ATP-binding protein
MAYRLVIEGLTVTLGDAERRFTLRAGDWAIRGGEVIGLTGPSGTGKTLLLEVLGMLRAPEGGAYRAEPLAGSDEPVQAFEGYWTDARAMTLCAKARARFFGFVPQAGGLLPFLSVAENVALSQKIARRPDDRWLRHLLDVLGLSRISHLRPAALSIGQRQRVAIARALAHRPFCVIADEPTAALDPENAHAAMGLLIDAAREGGAATLLSSHDFATLQQFDMRRMGLLITSAPHDPHVISTLTTLPDETARPKHVEARS